MPRTCKTIAKVVCLAVFLWNLWLLKRSKPVVSTNKNAIKDNVFISSELAILPDKMSFIWASTLDRKLRKFNLPKKYRYGLDFNVTRKCFHVVLLILLADDIATNPGPNSKIRCLVLNARSFKSIHRDEMTDQKICNLQRFQNLVYTENSDIICANETWLTKDISNDEILHPGFTI